jgi:hypothetical protein
MRRLSLPATTAAALLLSSHLTACGTVAGSTNMLTDDRIVSESAGALGVSPSDLTLLSRRTSGTNTYANLRAKDKREYTCIINGGNLLSFGMVNPPTCSKQ